MDRFEDEHLYYFCTIKSYLHSSMDRFEGSFLVYLSHLSIIYIPVWIDLKTDTTIRPETLKQNLHSSMDRFEAYKVFVPLVAIPTFTFQYG